MSEIKLTDEEVALMHADSYFDIIWKRKIYPNAIPVIKAIRNRTQSTLKDAKQAMDDWREHAPVPKESRGGPQDVFNHAQEQVRAAQAHLQECQRGLRIAEAELLASKEKEAYCRNK